MKAKRVNGVWATPEGFTGGPERVKRFQAINRATLEASRGGPDGFKEPQALNRATLEASGSGPEQLKKCERATLNGPRQIVFSRWYSKLEDKVFTTIRRYDRYEENQIYLIVTPRYSFYARLYLKEKLALKEISTGFLLEDH
ncbi:MAG: hypothetical protein ACTSQY_05785 [Candidatus Odinarchaeia archaeon]